MEPYRSYYPTAGLSLPQTERLAGRVLALPTGTAIGQKEIQTIASVIRAAFRDHERIRGVLPAAA